MHISRITKTSKTRFPRTEKFRFTNHGKNKSSFTLHAKQKCPFTRHEKSIGDPLIKLVACVTAASHRKKSEDSPPIFFRGEAAVTQAIKLVKSIGVRVPLDFRGGWRWLFCLNRLLNGRMHECWNRMQTHLKCVKNKNVLKDNIKHLPYSITSFDSSNLTFVKRTISWRSFSDRLFSATVTFGPFGHACYRSYRY